MKNTKHILFVVAALGVLSCNLNDSSKIDYENAIETKSNGLSIDEVFISLEDQQPGENTFIYGQTFYTNFKGLNGFVFENGDFFPELDVYVVSKAGDTVMQSDRLFGGYGQPKDVPALNGSLILANPILSGEKYTAHYRLSDVKGGGEFFSKMEFELIKDPNISVVENGLTAKEVYLFDRMANRVISDGMVIAGRSLSLDFQFLADYQMPNGTIDLGMETSVVDSDGNIIVRNPDALKNTSYKKLEPGQAVQSTLTLSEGRFNNPLKWIVRIWDKNGSGEIEAAAEITVTSE
ncbi:hypothetical protein [uncultured Croceitalea sp.]|uniref:hypothetical protein n=1 Tax=uncultured Croceitalea sp. TaxID=1798908 RepID=UPI0033068058